MPSRRLQRPRSCQTARVSVTCVCCRGSRTAHQVTRLSPSSLGPAKLTRAKFRPTSACRVRALAHLLTNGQLAGACGVASCIARHLNRCAFCRRNKLTNATDQGLFAHPGVGAAAGRRAGAHGQAVGRVGVDPWAGAAVPPQPVAHAIVVACDGTKCTAQPPAPC